jgi:adenosylhomocysteine nucleosidase
VITGIIVALPEELGTLTRKKLVPGCCSMVAENCLVALSGTGPDNARRASQLLIKEGAKRLLSWGCAGALDKHLKPGDLHMPERFAAADGKLYTADEHWRQQAFIALEEYFRIVRIGGGTLLESLHIVASSDSKRDLHERSGAQLVDMESCACAAVAAQESLPFLAIRAIADSALLDLPAAVAAAMQDNGQVALGKLLLNVLQRPQQIPGLIKLGAHFHAAKKSLTVAGEALHAITCFDNA